MANSYYVQSSVARTTCGLYVKRRTLKIKPSVHTIVFYGNCLKFVEDDSILLAATMCRPICPYLYEPQEKQYIKTSLRGFGVVVRNLFEYLD